ncbi:MAG: ABC transporter ATP-binding protein [Acidimicrobiales bacterium]
MPYDSDEVALDAPVVLVENLSVRYRRLRESTADESPQVRLWRRKEKRMVPALTDVSFSVPRGVTFAVIGANGAGKTTLMRAIAGIVAPDVGRITVRGTSTPMLARGVGFNRELTGRQNIILGGLASGLSMHEVSDVYQDIEDFAELGDFMNSPLKSYSTGMVGRLAFSLAVNLDPGVLLIDEGLSAGDARFKDKTLKKMRSLCEENRTVLLVTHAMGVVKEWADQAMWLDRGRVVAIGPPADIVGEYLSFQGVDEDTSTTEDF